MWLTEVGTPVAATDGDDGELGDDDGGADGGGDFLGGLDAETDVAFGVTDDDDAANYMSECECRCRGMGKDIRLETCALTGTGLLLDGLDLHDLILELWQEEVDDLVLLDWQRVQVDPVALSVSILALSRACMPCIATHSSIDFILPALTRRPSLVLRQCQYVLHSMRKLVYAYTGCHSCIPC